MKRVLRDVRRRPGCRCGGVWFAPGNAGSGNREDVYCATVSGPLVSGSTGGSVPIFTHPDSMS